MTRRQNRAGPSMKAARGLELLGVWVFTCRRLVWNLDLQSTFRRCDQCHVEWTHRLGALATLPDGQFYIRLACKLLKTNEFSCTILGTFFFRFARNCRARNIFSARVQLFANFQSPKFSCTSLETFFCVQDVAHETFSARVQLLQTFKVQIFVHKFGNFFWFAKLSRTKYFPRTCKKKMVRFVLSPSGTCPQLSIMFL